MPPHILGLLIPAGAFITIIGIISLAAVKVAKTIAGRGASPSELAHLRHQLEQQAAELQDTQTTLAQQSMHLAELQERLDFTERLLTQTRDRSALGAGDKGG